MELCIYGCELVRACCEITALCCKSSVPEPSAEPVNLSQNNVRIRDMFPDALPVDTVLVYPQEPSSLIGRSQAPRRHV